MAAKLTVRYWTSEVTQELQSYDLKVSIEESTDMPKEVFVIQRGVTPPQGAEEGSTDFFQCVADPVDLEEFPVGAPDLANEMPYYRVSEITLRFRSLIELEDVRDGIDEDLAGLVNALKIAESLPVYEEVVHE